MRERELKACFEGDILWHVSPWIAFMGMVMVPRWSFSGGLRWWGCLAAFADHLNWIISDGRR